MTNLEKLNQPCESSATAEDTAVGMLVACIADRYKIDIDESANERFVRTYHAMKEWLESEMEK